MYLGMSPFLNANNLQGALLMYHGMHDQNVGTDPVNSVAALPRAQRPRQDRRALSVPVRGSRPGIARDAARPVVALGGVARQVREERASSQSAGAAADHKPGRGRRTIDGSLVRRARPPSRGFGEASRLWRANAQEKGRMRSLSSGLCVYGGLLLRPPIRKTIDQLPIARLKDADVIGARHLPAAAPELETQARRTDQPLDRQTNGRLVLREPAIDAVADQFRQAASRLRDNRQLRREHLENRQRMHFLPRLGEMQTDVGG